MKTNNRPMVKVKEYEFVIQYSTENISLPIPLWSENEKLNETYILLENQKFIKKTGNTREIESPMNDTEYIEYLETKINNNQNCNCFLACNDKDVCLYQQLLKENQELKEQMSFNNKLFLDTFKVQKEQFLKVVENVLKKHDIDMICMKCSCGFDFVNSKTNEWEHLLKEIRKAMENGE